MTGIFDIKKNIEIYSEGFLDFQPQLMVQ